MDPPLAFHNLGGNAGGPTLLMLHANSLHSLVFSPMLGVLQQHFGAIMAIDAPGQGGSPPWVVRSREAGSAAGIAEVVYKSILALGLQGCFVFGHSMGGCLAALMESAHPGTFSAIYAYEPPLYTPAGEQGEASRGASKAGQVLGMLARKRRSRFPSQRDALQSFASKPPFSAWHPLALEAYVQHGTRRAGPDVASHMQTSLHSMPGAKCAHQRVNHAPAESVVHALSSPQAAQRRRGVPTPLQQPQGPMPGGSANLQQLDLPPQPQPQPRPRHLNPQPQTQLQGSATDWVLGEVELCCSPATEGAVYAAFEPPPLIPRDALPRCPFAWAVGGAAQGVHARLPLLGEEGIKDLPHACLRRFLRLSHFGPQEDPEEVAHDVLAFFQCDIHTWASARAGSQLRGREVVIAGRQRLGAANGTNQQTHTGPLVSKL